MRGGTEYQPLAHAALCARWQAHLAPRVCSLTLRLPRHDSLQGLRPHRLAEVQGGRVPCMWWQAYSQPQGQGSGTATEARDRPG